MQKKLGLTGEVPILLKKATINCVLLLHKVNLK